MAYIKNNWVDREGQTRYHETIDDDGALIFTPDYEKVTEMGTPVNADNMNHIEEGIGEHEERITTLESLPDVYLKTNQITNCITEIPQRIKLELKDGTLTLKAGSVLIEPNGSSVFEDENIKTDKTFNLADSTDGKYLVFRDDYFKVEKCVSGSTDSLANTAWHIWYDTENNLVKVITGTAGVVGHTTTLPFSLVTVANGAITSIDQVFNGFGYIGSTVWVDKGVKGLIPNGRNEDGTLNNIEVVSDNIKLQTHTSTYNSDIVIGLSVAKDVSHLNVGAYSYDEVNNRNYNLSNEWRWCVVGTATRTDTKISNFQPKQPFRAVDYSDKSKISGWGMPSNKYIDLTLGASGTTYTAPANGWFVFSKRGTSNNQYNKLSNGKGFSFTQFVSTNNSEATVFCPAIKNNVITCNYNTAGETTFLRFIYAEGDK